MSDHDHEATGTGPLFSESPPAEAHPSPRSSGHRRAPRRRSGCLPILVVLVVAAVVGYGVFRWVDPGNPFDGVFGSEAEDFPGPGSGAVTFEVATGDSISTMGRNLESLGVVASVEAFVEAAEADSGSGSIQEGLYRLRLEMAAADVVDLLVSGETQGTQFTFTPGKTVEEIVRLLARDTDIGRGEFEAVLDDPGALGLPEEADGNAEGYLFPGSYLVFADSTAESILADMVKGYERAARQVDLVERAERLGYTPHEIMTIASLVQAEGSLLDEEGKAKIARVIYNRLEEVPPNYSAGFLQLDATVNYALGEDVVRLTDEQLAAAADSPYSTYANKGLPPGPIATPGPNALEAALAPAEGSWFYYVTVNLRSGLTKFAETPEEFAVLEAELDEYCDTQSDRC